ncbi:MAG: hypothetical protein ACP5XB_01335 [Isosphaeraceae bacterium]
MRSIGFRLPILAALALGWSGAPARAFQVVYLETMDWAPTSSVLTFPTTYVAATSYVVPASYVIPTAYTTAYVTETALVSPTTYLAPTYYETRFRRGGLFGRRLVATTRGYYLPTTAYYPTTYYYYYPTTYSSSVLVDRAIVPSEYVVASTSSSCCGTEVVASSTPTVRSLPAEQAPAAPRTSRGSQSHVVQSEPENQGAVNSSVTPLPEEEPRGRVEQSQNQAAGNTAQTPAAPQAATRGNSTTVTPPQPQPVPWKQATPSAGAPTGKTQTQTQPKVAPIEPAPTGSQAGGLEPPTPVAPADGSSLFPAPDEKPGSGAGTVRHEARKPSIYNPRTIRPEFRNILFGSVKARQTGELEEGVRVTVSSRTNAFEDRVQETDAAGRFAVRVPDGDWTVKVTMPSGRIYAVSQITVMGGAITDDSGRDIPSLVITR